MLSNNHNNSPPTPRTRLERLLRERELRRSNKPSSLNEEARDAYSLGEVNSYDLFTNAGDSCGSFNEEDVLEGISVVKDIFDGFQRPEGRTYKQRLLVVANRLPVSAVRKGKETWHLEISVGGLVSALLGMYCIVNFIRLIVTSSFPLPSFNFMRCLQMYKSFTSLFSELYMLTKVKVFFPFLRTKGVRGKVDWLGWCECT